MSGLHGWQQQTVAGTVEELHGLDVPDDPVRTLRWCNPTDVAVVLGRSQDASILDESVLSELGIAVARRRSGGGLVLVEPSSMCWFDVVVPAGDVLWDDDVGRAFHWLGNAIADALHGLGSHDARVHTGAMLHGLFAREVCFLSTGPGEVLASGRKVVGISQRRRKSGAVFHCSVLTAPDAQDVTDLTVLGSEAKQALSRRLEESVGWVDAFDRAAFMDALAEQLGRL